MASTDNSLFSYNHHDTRKEKSPSALRTISEASDTLDVPQHVLRFWETKFPQIKPLKRNGGRRFYRPQDLEVLQQIKHLLYQQGYTIKGAKKAIDEFLTARSQDDFSSEQWQSDVPAANVNDNIAQARSDALAELALALREPESATPEWQPYLQDAPASAPLAPIFPREELAALRAQLQQARQRLQAYLTPAEAA